MSLATKTRTPRYRRPARPSAGTLAVYRFLQAVRQAARAAQDLADLEPDALAQVIADEESRRWLTQELARAVAFQNGMAADVAECDIGRVVLDGVRDYLATNNPAAH